MNRHHEKRIFSDYYKSAVFDSEFNIKWCDDERMFRRIAVAHERIKDKLITANHGETVVHFFLYNGSYHRAFIDRIPDVGFICRVSREITDEELKFEDLFEFLDEICHSSINVISMADMIEDYVGSTKYNPDIFHEECLIQKKVTMSIYNYCQNMIKAFNNNTDCDKLPLQRYLNRTLDIIQFATRRLSKKVTLFTDLVFPVSQIDYSKFEMALYNIIKIALIYSAGNDDILLYLRRVTTKNIELEMSFRLNTEYRLMNCKLEMHVIKHIFRKLNGYFEFFEENNVFYAKGSFKSDYSFDEADITPGRDIRFIGTPEILEKKENNDRYIKIYSKIPAQKHLLASEVAELKDVDDKEIWFAEMFFGDIEIYD